MTAIDVGLIGAGIGTSLSPSLHEREAARLGLDYSYRLLDLDELERPATDVGAILAEAREEGLRGVNVTHPCKQLVIEHLDALAPEAAALGAVNTVVIDPEGFVGHNTDGGGFAEAFTRRLRGAATDDVVLVGAGGAGSAVAHALLGLGVARLSLVDADAARARGLTHALTERFGPGRAVAAAPADLERLLPAADGVVHATPTGMADHPGSAIPAELLVPPLWVADIVYMPVETELLRTARRRGCRTLDGTPMVALQAAGSLELFTGHAPDRDRMLRHVDELTGAAQQAA